ncbi:non-hydrolyzing UDP-N-acetylglucosamine 2-epimerase [Erysipelothrix anatis]|uniref:non-hydrolyzing UDP-N-acetylglucosamine 2-epimerase n=1 Tax=Erysipelothrix anatis TaxID=2683713 RepID=UPI001359EEDD|nr:UDP-N-acetylglucosamine 2-epimerase (non-hydrolyzing) [Erysipelothrix anatis]
MIKVLSVFGTRPEAIKMCPLVKELESRQNIDSYVCVTGQHREMLDSVLHIFDVKPDFDLAVMKKGQTLSDITTSILTGFSKVLDEVKPDIVLVHGDTSTAYASALASFYKEYPIGHVEAGLRTWDMKSPFPEEFNRQAIDLVAQYGFAPSSMAEQNLINEQTKMKVFVTGNTSIDALSTTIEPNYSHEVLDWVGEGNKMILLTAHRRENLGQPMRQMFKAILRICDEHPEVRVVYPIHMNPKVRAIADEVLSGNKNINIIEPLDVIDFHNFLDNAYIIVTDSGGIQEEAPSLGKPVLVMRETTERPEGVAAGTLKVVGVEEETIYSSIKELLTQSHSYETMSGAVNPYGDGTASKQIADIIEKYLGK